MRWAAVLLVILVQDTPATTPEAFFGHPIGQERTLFKYGKLVDYLKKLSTESPRLQMVSLGRTTLGRDMVMAAISTPENLKAAARHREIARALYRGEGDADALTREGKAIVLFTMGIHSNEIMSSQMVAEMIYRLATGREEGQWLKDVILLIVPSANPDGQEMIVEWYQKYLDTEFEGGPMPWLYHPYAGHDNNRDFFMFNLKESGPIADVMYRDWCPQVVVDFHQMGQAKARYFIPPYQDPPHPDVHPLVWREISAFSSKIAYELEEKGKSGVVWGEVYSSWFPSALAKAPWWHNQTAILFEAASCRIATPIRVEPNETDLRQRQNMPNPWKGGWWRPRDIVDYQLISGLSVLKTASQMRENLLRNMHFKAREQVGRARREGPFAYALPFRQGDRSAIRRMIRILEKGGVEVRELAEATPEFPAGTPIVFTAQPAYGYLRVLLEDRNYPDWCPSPYDVTGWALPAMLGVPVRKIDEPTAVKTRPWSPSTEPVSFETGSWECGAECTDASRWINRCLAAGVEVRRGSFGKVTASFEDPKTFEACRDGLDLRLAPSAPDADSAPIKAPVIGVYKPWQASMDEGWLRHTLDAFEFKYRTLEPKDMANLDDLNVIILPDVEPSILIDGKERADGEKSDKKEPERYPPEYRDGMKKEGVERLERFVREGGTLITLDRSSRLAIDKFPIPVKNALGGVKKTDFNCPGSVMNAAFNDDPLCAGMPRKGSFFYSGQVAFDTQLPFGETDRRVAAAFPEDRLLRSGYVLGENKVAGKPIVVEAALGKGRVVLFAFSPHFRAQTYGTFKMLFNAVWGHRH